MVERDEQPALQVIVLGSGGGPKEDNTTAFLVRSMATGWRRGSVLAVDAGTHLAAITRILEGHSSDYSPSDAQRPITLIEGPFEGLEIPHSSASSNAAHITRTLIDTYLITHPHLDHICGFVINTASLPGTRPKRLAGLPTTIEAFKNHIFNNVIWPNLSDENNGAGLVTYMRLVEGGSPALGNGEGKGYVEICEGLSVKTWSVSHGHCLENHSHRGSNVGLGSNSSQIEASPRSNSGANSQLQASPRSSGGNLHAGDLSRLDAHQRYCVYNSSAYFIRDIATGREVLIFGDVEPDSISLSPRNKQVWMEAAPKITSGQLGAIFIECSYDDSQSDDTLFGHLAPRFLIEELKSLANEIDICHSEDKCNDTKKRKRKGSVGPFYGSRQRRARSPLGQPVSPLSQPRPRSVLIDVPPPDGNDELMEDYQNSCTTEAVIPVRSVGKLPLKGVKIVIIHMKDKLDDGPYVGDIVLRQLTEYEEQAQLGCEFEISEVGKAIYL